MTDTPAPPPQATSQANTPAPKKEKVKRVYMLHNKDGEPLGKFNSLNGPRNAALKATSKKCKVIGDNIELHLRETGKNLVKVYEGTCSALETPQVVNRSGREITYTKKPNVRFTKVTYNYDERFGKKPSEEAPEEK